MQAAALFVTFFSPMTLTARGPLDSSDPSIRAGTGDIVLSRGKGGAPGALDSQRKEENTGAEILCDLFEGSTTATVDANVVPGTAASWTTSDDGLVYTLTPTNTSSNPTFTGVAQV